MAFTRAKNPATDSGFKVTNWKEASGDLTGYFLFLLAVATAWNLAKSPGESLGRRIRNVARNLFQSAQETSGTAIQVN